MWFPSFFFGVETKRKKEGRQKERKEQPTHPLSDPSSWKKQKKTYPIPETNPNLARELLEKFSLISAKEKKNLAGSDFSTGAEPEEIETNGLQIRTPRVRLTVVTIQEKGVETEKNFFSNFFLFFFASWKKSKKVKNFLLIFGNSLPCQAFKISFLQNKYFQVLECPPG